MIPSLLGAVCIKLYDIARWAIGHLAILAYTEAGEGPIVRTEVFPQIEILFPVL
jgi:hypothetical protein